MEIIDCIEIVKKKRRKYYVLLSKQNWFAFILIRGTYKFCSENKVANYRQKIDDFLFVFNWSPNVYSFVITWKPFDK